MFVTLSLPSAPRPPKVFRADHPFLLALKETSSNGLLFLAKISSPKK